MKKRSIVLVTSMMLAVLLIAGGTFAWFTASADPVRNEFKAGTLEMGLYDVFNTCLAQNVNPGDCFQKAVWVCNTGTKRMYVRVKVSEEFAGLPTVGVVNYNINDKYWVDHGDGYYYYKYQLPKGCCTPPLFKLNTRCKKIPSLCFDGEAMNDDYQGKDFTVIIESDAVQVTNGAPAAVWGSPHGVNQPAMQMIGEQEENNAFDFLLEEELGFEAPELFADEDVVEE